MTRVIPVIDVKGGQVVRAVAGRREEYGPIWSALTPSCAPLAVAEAFREQFGFTELYVADLDAIQGREPDRDTAAELQRSGSSLWLDAGVRDLAGASALQALGVAHIILALETLPGLPALDQVLGAISCERLAFSLDMKGGRVLAEPGRWPSADAARLAAAVLDRGIGKLIVLDLAYVGGNGPSAAVLRLCRDLKRSYPEVEIITGGGVQNVADLRMLEAHGVSAALVASALHDGRITRELLASEDLSWPAYSPQRSQRTQREEEERD